MDEDGATLEVGFAIDFHDSFGQLKSLDDLIGVTQANAVREFQKLEAASQGALNLGGATAQVTAFGNAATKAARDAAREFSQAEASGERMLQQLTRQNATFGLSRQELRSLRAEERALAAERVGNTDLAQRLRAAEATLLGKERDLATQAAAARASAAQAAADAEVRAQQQVIAQLRERERLEAVIRQNTGLGAARATDAGAGFSALAAQAAEQEALAKDRAAAANQRLADAHDRLATMVRGSHAAQMADVEAAERLRMATDPLYAATKRLNAEIAESTRLYHAGVTAPAEYARQQEVLTGRLNGLAATHDTVARASARSRSSLTQLSFQINDVATMAAMGAPPFQIFASQIGQITQVAQGAEGGVRGLMGEIGGFAVRFAPAIVAATVLAGGIALVHRAVSDVDTKPMIAQLGLTDKEIKKLDNTTITFGDSMTAVFQVGWDRIASAFGTTTDGITSKWTSALDAITANTRQNVAEIYGLVAAAGRLLDRGTSGTLDVSSFAAFFGQMKDDYRETTQDALRFFDDVGERAVTNKMNDLRKQADEIRGDRTSKADKHAERLAREAQAIEAQIRNLDGLADAYRASGAEALIAEARVAAESKAIKARGDVEAAVAREIRLELANRVSDAAKASFGMREQAVAMGEVNGLVSAGLAPAERANDLVQERLAMMPLLAAREVAQARGFVAEVARINQALDDQREAQRQVREERERAAFNSAFSAGGDRLAELQAELRLVGELESVRARELTRIKATTDAAKFPLEDRDRYIEQQLAIADAQIALQQQQNDFNQSLTFTADLFAAIDEAAVNAGRGMADAFGAAGAAMGDLLSITTGYFATDERLRAERDAQIRAAGHSEAAIARENQLYALRSASLQVGAFGDMAVAARGFFDEGTDGYKALRAAEQAFRAVEFALSVRAIAQDAIETGSSLANSAARAAASATEAVVNAIKSLPFPLNLAAGAATVAALASIGIAVGGTFGGGRGNTLEAANEGRGTVLGDAEAQSQSLRRSIDALREVDLLTATYSREMLGSLRSIDGQIGGLASVIVRAGNVNADLGITEGFKSDLTGGILKGIVTGGGLFSKIPVIGGLIGGIGDLLGSLFGSKKEVVGSGLFAGPQTIGSILSNGFDADYYSDIKKTKKFLGIKTGTSYSTQYANADPALENEFTLILRSFNDAIAAAAGPLGVATSDIQQRLNGFVVSIGKIDTRDLTGAELQEKLTAVFGAAADRMANAAFPGIERFQKVGEGTFETLVRVASTVETVSGLFAQLGRSTRNLGIDAQLALVEQFDGLEDFSSATQAYFETFYTREEQAQAKLAQFSSAFAQMGITLPSSLAGFRALVEAQNLTTAAGRETYAMLLQVAPAFADLQSALNGARSAADILSERQDLERKLLELQGNTDAIRQLDLARVDASNRALQQQIWAIEDAQEAARAAEQLRDAWASAGDGIMDEVRRIRGLTGSADQGGSFAQIMGQFNAASAAARGGDLDAAKSLPGLSQALLRSAELAATSRQELQRVQAQTAASLEATNAAVAALSRAASTSDAALLAASAAQQASSDSANDNGARDMAETIRDLRDEVAQLRRENSAGHAATAANTGKTARMLENVTGPTGGDAIAVQLTA